MQQPLGQSFSGDAGLQATLVMKRQQNSDQLFTRFVLSRMTEHRRSFNQRDGFFGEALLGQIVQRILDITQNEAERFDAIL